MKQKKPSKLIQQFYEQGRHQYDIYDELTNKQITLKVNSVTAAELTAIAKVFNMPLSGLLSELIDENIKPMINSLERHELIEAGVCFESTLSKMDLPEGWETTGDGTESKVINPFQELLNQHNKEEAE